MGKGPAPWGLQARSRASVGLHTHILYTQLLQGLLCPFLWPLRPLPVRSVLSAIQDTASDPPHRRSPQPGAYGERGPQSPPLAPLLHFLALGSSPLSPSHLPDALPSFWWGAGGNAPVIEITPLCSKIQPIKSSYSYFARWCLKRGNSKYLEDRAGSFLSGCAPQLLAQWPEHISPQETSRGSFCPEGRARAETHIRRTRPCDGWTVREKKGEGAHFRTRFYFKFRRERARNKTESNLIHV